jgi:hypothetical protein
MDTVGNQYPELCNYVIPEKSMGHYFTWAGDPNYEIPEGYFCACGQMKAHWEICPTCGNRVLKLVPMELNVEMSSSDLKAVLQKI